jgi:hypothetical protein
MIFRRQFSMFYRITEKSLSFEHDGLSFEKIGILDLSSM